MNKTLTRIGLATTFCAALALPLSTAMAQSEPQVINVPLSRPGEPVSLDIGILSARIEVIGEDREDASFEVSVEEGTRKIITPSGTKSLKTGAYSLEVEEENNHLELDTDWRANKVNVVARIPRQADVELGTVNNGEIIVRNISGNLELSNTNGPISATGISGTVIAETVNDDIDVSMVGMSTDTPSSFSTINGSISIGLPPDAGAELHIDSADGEITSDFEVEVLPSKPVISREDDRDGVEVRVESVIIAKVNGGGPVIRMKSLYGDIHIRKSAN